MGGLNVMQTKHAFECPFCNTGHELVGEMALMACTTCRSTIIVIYNSQRRTVVAVTTGPKGLRPSVRVA